MTSADELLAEAEALSSGIWARRSGSALDEATRDAARYRQAFDAFMNRGDAGRAVRLVSALRDVWSAHGQYAEGLAWIDEILVLPALPSASRATALDQAGALAFAEGQYARARQFFEDSLELRRSGNSMRDVALTLNHLAAAIRWGSGDAFAAEPLYEESLAVARQTGDCLLVGAALMPLGALALDRGAIAQAQHLMRDGLQQYTGANVATAFPLALEQFAALAAARGQGVRGLRLASAGAAWRRRLSTYPTPYAAWVARYVSAARQLLSEVQTEEAWRAGEAMSLDQAIDYALSEDASD
jgi:tetratricopeptide (TPR) repeat protein